MPPLQLLPVNTTYNAWTVKRHLGGSWYECQCACGNKARVLRSSLVNGSSKRCRDCGNKEPNKRHRKHGHGANGACTPEYMVWTSMIQRCHNPKHAQYHNYGGRGIHVAEEWRGTGYLRFLAHVGLRPSSRHSIDRIRNNDGYVPGNVRWATRVEQARNMRTNVSVTIGSETRLLVEWAERTGVTTDVIRRRIKAGWPPEKAVFSPVRKRS